MEPRARDALLSVVLTTALAACSGDDAARSEVRDVVAIRHAQVVVEIAERPAAQARGLGHRDSLEWGRGMLFVYERATFQGFWMKGMRFPIDIVWLRERRIVDIAHRVPAMPPGTPDRSLPVYRPRELADLVLEVPAGFAEAHSWQRGDTARITLRGH